MASEITQAIFQLTKQKKDLENLKQRMKISAEKLAAKNNHLLAKHQSFIGSHHRLIPYKVNKYLTRIKDQPNFVKSKDFDQSWREEDRGKEEGGTEGGKGGRRE